MSRCEIRWHVSAAAKTAGILARSRILILVCACMRVRISVCVNVCPSMRKSACGATGNVRHDMRRQIALSTNSTF